jgi:hypothetical protein
MNITSPNPHLASAYDHMGEVAGKDLWTSYGFVSN